MYVYDTDLKRERDTALLCDRDRQYQVRVLAVRVGVFVDVGAELGKDRLVIADLSSQLLQLSGIGAVDLKQAVDVSHAGRASKVTPCVCDAVPNVVVQVALVVDGDRRRDLWPIDARLWQ